MQRRLSLARLIVCHGHTSSWLVCVVATMLQLDRYVAGIAVPGSMELHHREARLKTRSLDVVSTALGARRAGYAETTSLLP